MRIYRIIDIVTSIFLLLIGILGILKIDKTIHYNYFLIILVICFLMILPLYLYSLYKNKFPICSFLPIILLLTYFDKIYSFDNTNSDLMVYLLSIVEVSAVVLSVLVTALIHSRKSVQKVDQKVFLCNEKKSNLPFRKIFLLFRDVFIIFMILLGILFFSNVAFDLSKPVDFEVTIVEISSVSPDRFGLGSSYIEVVYTGTDNNIFINSLSIPRYQATQLSIGEKIQLKYRMGFFNDPYYWVL